MIKITRKELNVPVKREISLQVVLRGDDIIKWANKCEDVNDLWLVRKCINAKLKIMRENGVEMPRD